VRELGSIVKEMIKLRSRSGVEMTLLAVCPNSEAVLEAAIKSAAMNRSILLFAATLNQVDLDGGYTGWTPGDFVRAIKLYGKKYNRTEGLYPCLDHGGPWLKDIDTQRGLGFDETFANVKGSIEACVRAGYSLLHIDPTVDRTLQKGETIPMELVVARTVELIGHAERVRELEGRPTLAYEVGTEEVHGGLADISCFSRFISLLREKMAEARLSHAWPCFFVAQVGTNLGTPHFDSSLARALFETLRPEGSLAKGHYSDWVENPAEYPRSGMGGANVGPELTAEEFGAMSDLADKEEALLRHSPGAAPSHFMSALQDAVVDSGRWRKWLTPDEAGLDFRQLPDARRLWLLQTGSRYVWTAPTVVRAREVLWENIARIMPDPHGYVVNRIADSIDRYLTRFNLFDSVSYFD
jgi:tagatose-1,6-bisphosphate aldolase non-catalytic subunit AgaZ/GatZ